MTVSEGNSGSPIAQIDIIGGELSLDFTNTVSDKGGESVHDYLTAFSDLIIWGERAESLTSESAAALRQTAEAHPQETQPVWRRAIRLREALYRIFLANTEQKPFAAEDLACLNQELARAMGHLRVKEGADGLTWGWEEDVLDLDQIIWPIAHSAAELLVSGEIERIHQCKGIRCGWFFVDRSKNHSRRWCDMKVCGNAAKVRRFRSRRQKQ
jgi:predicted RNA-binding Zn ribbon-like protein